MSSRKRPRRPSFDSGSGSGSGSGSDSSDAEEAEGMPEPSVSKKARRLSVSGSESDNNSGSDSDAESGSGSSSGGGSDSGSDGGDSDADSVGSFAAAAYAPRSFTRVSAPGLPLHDAVTSADTELWLFRVPVDFDTSLISKKKLKMRLRKRTPGATVGQFHGEVDGSERRFNIVAGHENVAAQTINLFADKSGQVLMGKPFRRSFVIAEDMTATGSAFELQDQRVPPKPNLNYKFLPSTHGTKLPGHLEDELEQLRDEDAAKLAAQRAARRERAVSLSGTVSTPTKATSKVSTKSGKKSVKKSAKKKKSKKDKKKKKQDA